MNTTGWPLWLRIVGGIIGVLFLWWWISRKWDRASAYSDAMAAENEEQKKWFEQTKKDTRIQQLIKEIKSRYPIAEESMASADSYFIKYICFYNPKMKIISPDDHAAAYTSFFLKGKDYVMITKNLATGEMAETKVSKFSFDLSLPEWVKRKPR